MSSHDDELNIMDAGTALLVQGRQGPKPYATAAAAATTKLVRVDQGHCRRSTGPESGAPGQSLLSRPAVSRATLTVPIRQSVLSR